MQTSLTTGRELWKHLVAVPAGTSERVGWAGWGCRGSSSSSPRLLTSILAITPVAAGEGEK